MKKKVPIQETPPKAEEHETHEKKSTVSRRKFLKASALGAGALALPIVAHGSTDPLQPEVGEDNDTPPAASKPAVDWATQTDTWAEPWEFVQKDWPGQSLHLDVVEHAAPVALLGNIGTAEDVNVGTLLFSWNGISPAPTMRVGGDETLHVNVRNMLGPNDGVLLIPNGKVPPLPPASDSSKNTFLDKDANGDYIYVVPTSDYCRPIHSNHKHQLHTTNIHFHGSHVTPYLNTDGTRSDDIFVRIIPQGDYQLRQTSKDPDNIKLQDPACWPLQGSEVMGQQKYEYRLGKPGGARETHPPGTHWYHPHAHGSTFTQVASGMAGVVIVEGDVDAYLKEQLDNGNGSFHERVIVLQRIVGPTSVDFEEDLNDLQKTKSSAAFAAVNGQSTATVENYIVVAPEAVERWRVLNAGVDGQAYIDLMVLALNNPDDLVNELLTDSTGKLTGVQTITWKYYGPNRNQVNPDILTINIASGGKPITWTKTTAAGTTTTNSATGGADILEVLYSQMAEYLYSGTMNHLASDGITLVNGDGKYHTRPVTQPMMISPANRMDFLFQAPSQVTSTTTPNPLTIWIRQTLTGADAVLASAGAGGTKILQKTATIITRGEATPPPAINPKTGNALDLNDLVFPPVPGYLKPVTVQDITVKPGDPDYNQRTVNTGAGNTNNNGKLRGRRVIYSGWGGSLPQGTSNRKNEVAAFYRIPQKVTSGGSLGGFASLETMMIDCRKFNDDPADLEDIGHHMLLETAEEWTVSNFTMTLFTDDQKGPLPARPSKPDPRTHLGNKPYPSSQQKTNITTRAVDHPFHIHVNPCWVVGIYDWEGKRLNWNYERYTGVPGKEPFYPRWHDVIRLPRNGGWVVFRSRFWDFDGQYVNHCHILQHEDNGMMQGIAVVPDASQTDYVPFDRGTNYRPSGTNPVFPKPTWQECYEMDWGLGDTPTETGEEQRTRCIALRTRLRTPQP